MENINLKIHNYRHSEQQNKQIKNKMEILLKQIPCDSRVLLNFDYKNKVFHGYLKVDCDGRTFFSADQNALLAPLAGALCKKVQKQVMKWKKTRTIEEITGVIALKPPHREKSHKKAS